MFIFTGKGKTATQPDVDEAKFLEEVIKALKLDKPVIVSPSASGKYSLPYLFNGKCLLLVVNKHMSKSFWAQFHNHSIWLNFNPKYFRQNYTFFSKVY